MMLSADESQETTREKEGPQRARGNAVNSVQEHFACNEASSASDWIEIVAAWTACIFCVAGRHVVFASWRSARNAGRKTVEQGSGAVHQALIRPSVAGEAICYAFSLAPDSTNQATDSLEVPLNAELRDKGGHWDAKKAWLHVQQSLITRSAFRGPLTRQASVSVQESGEAPAGSAPRAKCGFRWPNSIQVPRYRALPLGPLTELSR